MIVDFSDNGLQLNIVLQDRESGSGCTLTFLLQRSSRNSLRPTLWAGWCRVYKHTSTLPFCSHLKIHQLPLHHTTCHWHQAMGFFGVSFSTVSNGPFIWRHVSQHPVESSPCPRLSLHSQKQSIPLCYIHWPWGDKKPSPDSVFSSLKTSSLFQSHNLQYKKGGSLTIPQVLVLSQNARFYQKSRSVFLLFFPPDWIIILALWLSRSGQSWMT